MREERNGGNRATGIRATLIFLCALAGSVSAEVTSNQNVKRVAIIYGFTDIGIWTQRFSSSVHGQAMLSDSRIRVSPMFLGLEQLDDAEQETLAKSGLFDAMAPNLVVSVFPTAGNFLKRWGDVFAPGATRLYVHPSESLANELAGDPDSHVLTSYFPRATEETIRIIPQLNPETEHLYVLSGSGISDQAYLAAVKGVIERMQPALEVHYLVGQTPDELVTTLNEAPSTSALLLGNYDRDRTGNSSTGTQFASLVTSRVDLPAFGMIDSLVGYGVIGGSVTSSSLYGKRTSALIRNILLDEPLASGDSLLTTYQFDGRQLDRWGIDRTTLPQNTEILHDEVSMTEKYAWQIAAGLFVLLLQLILIIALIEALRRRRRAEAERDEGLAENVEQEALFTTVINSIPDAVLVTDSDAQLSGFNRAARSIFGEGLSSSLSLSNLIVEAGDPKVMLDLLSQVAHPQRVTCTRTDGTTFPGEILLSSTGGDNGMSHHYFAMVRDISRRLTEEEEELQRHKMEALGNLVSGISHDFNNVLGVISSHTELARQRIDDAQASGDALENVSAATERARRLVSQIMSFSRDSTVDQKPINLAALARETIDLVKVSVPANVRLTVDIQDEHWISGSAVQLQQILMNLLTNSHQAIATSRGVIAVSLHSEQIDTPTNLSHNVLPEGDYCVLTIADNGQGMSAEVADRMFDPFYTTKAVGEGSGMGMTIVYNLLAVHHACMDVVSVVDEGTRISIYFPVTKLRPETSSASRRRPVATGQGQRILLVDDEKALLLASRELLEGIGYKVDSFSDPGAALDAFQRFPDAYDVLLTDEKMPGLTGLSLVASVREIRADMPVIILTGYSDDLQEDTIEEWNLGGILRKPFRLAELSQLVASTLASATANNPK